MALKYYCVPRAFETLSPRSFLNAFQELREKLGRLENTEVNQFLLGMLGKLNPNVMDLEPTTETWSY